MELSYPLPMIAKDMPSDSDGSLPQYADDPLVLEPVFAQAVKNGVNTLIAPTACLTEPVLTDCGRDDDLGSLAHGIIASAVAAADEDIKVAATLSENMLSESGHADVAFEDEYMAYLEKLTSFRNAGADLAIAKDHRSLTAMRAAVLAAKVAAIPLIVIMDCDEEGVSPTGTDYLAALITLQSLGADGFGIRTSGTPEELFELIHDAFPHAEIPLFVMSDLSALAESDIQKLCFGGASGFIDISGGLTAVQSAHIARYGSCFDQREEKDSRAAAIYCDAFFLPDDLELTEPLDCSYDISDELIDFDDENYNAVCVMLRSTDEAAVLAESAAMSRLPVCVNAQDPTTLEAALRYFQGRLIVDTSCGIPREELEALGEKYGAILY